MQPQRFLVRGAEAIVTLGAMVACGGDRATGPTSDHLSQAEAQQVARSLFTELENALSRPGTLAPAAASRSVATQLTQGFSSNCTNGGTLSGSFDYIWDPRDTQGTGTVTGSIAVTPNACKVSTGTRLIAVGGSINFAFAQPFTRFAQSGDFTFHGSGTLTWSGGSCLMDYTVTITPQGKETVTGTFCGGAVNSSS